MSILHSGQSLVPIPTAYGGYLFRSRLEARWAVFFDALRITWEYEHQGYRIGQVLYLPDFWLPTFNGGCFCEVKPLNSDDWEKAHALANVRDKAEIVWMADGTPGMRAYNYFQWETQGNSSRLMELVGIPNGGPAWNQDRMFSDPGSILGHDRSIRGDQIEFLGKQYLDAVRAARSYRF